MTHPPSFVRLLLAGLLATSVVFACKKDDDGKADPSTIQCASMGFTDANTRYGTEIKTILTKNGCLGCHSTAGLKEGGVVLDEHASIKKVVDDDRLLGAIAHLKGYQAMPQGGFPMMPQAEICQIKFWVDNGAKNN